MEPLKQGGKSMNRQAGRKGAFLNLWRVIGWGTIAALVALPAVAMQFTREVNWTASDFVFAAVLLGGVGLAFEMAVRASGNIAYRAGAAIALGLSLLLLWANAAVGIAGSENNPVNLWFNLVPLVALIGTLAARLRARGMAAAMVVAALAQLLAGVIAQSQGHFTWVFTGLWMCGWLASAWLLRRAAQTV
jgi:hypothetical protein